MKSLTTTEYDKITNKNTCPDCDAKEKFISGPSGGVSQNITCVGCHMRFNVGPVSGERIGKEEHLRSDPIPLPEGTMSWNKHNGCEYLTHSCGGGVEFRAIDHETSAINCGLCKMRIVFKDQKIIDIKPGPNSILTLFEYIRDNNPLTVCSQVVLKRMRHGSESLSREIVCG